MVEHLVFERYSWFNGRIRAGNYPNAASLASRFEICHRTAQRTIEKMRERFGAPFEYDPVRKGYFYPDSSFELPQLPVSQNELLAILLARNLLSQSAGGIIGDAISSFGKKLLAQTGELGLSEQRLRESFSAIWNGYSPADGQTFQTLATALIQSRRIAFRYYSPAQDQWNDRTADPYHLQHYNGSWILLAWCHLRNGWRKFNLSRIDKLQPTEQNFVPQPSEQWQGQMQGAFGIFQSGELVPVNLRFSPHRARWVNRELWHPRQETRTEADGSLLMRLLVTDFREIKLRIMQYGAEVEVLEPAELRDEIIDGLLTFGEQGNASAVSVSRTIFRGISAPASLKHGTPIQPGPNGRDLPGHLCPGLIEAGLLVRQIPPFPLRSQPSPMANIDNSSSVAIL